MGIEPTTFGLGGRCSTFELHELIQPLPTHPRYKSLFKHPASPKGKHPKDYYICPIHPTGEIGEKTYTAIDEGAHICILWWMVREYKDMISKSTELLGVLTGVFPPLLPTLRKGDNGRVAVIGGSLQFTGAPFYAAISSLKVGGDLAHIFCSKSASPSIKAYSPEIIVHPVFFSEAEVKLTPEQLKMAHGEWLGRILTWRNAISTWVIGPGLGRDRYMSEFFPILIRNLPEGALTILDADGIYFLSKHPQLMEDLKRLRPILTPNAREMTFLKDILKIQVEGMLEKYRNNEEVQQIEGAEGCEGFTLFVKGTQDLILSSRKSFIVRTEGGKKRCGGLGDILSGAVAVCAQWDFTYGPVLASRIVRIATRKGFEKEGRGTTAPIVISELTQVVKGIEAASL